MIPDVTVPGALSPGRIPVIGTPILWIAAAAIRVSAVSVRVGSLGIIHIPAQPARTRIGAVDIDVDRKRHDGNVDIAGVDHEVGELRDEALGRGLQVADLVVVGHRSRRVEHQRHPQQACSPGRGRRGAVAHGRESRDPHEVGGDRAGAVDLNGIAGGAAAGRVGCGDRDTLRIPVGVQRVEIADGLGGDLRLRDGADRQILRQHQRGRIRARPASNRGRWRRGCSRWPLRRRPGLATPRSRTSPRYFLRWLRQSDAHLV